METDDSIPPTTDTVANVTDAAGQAWESTREKAVEALQSGEDYVRENPVTTVLGIFGIGFVIGLLVGRSIAHDEISEHPV